MSGTKFQILSLDGGGIKGLFSAAILAHLESDLNIRIIDHFDLITGTSTDGIIAIALSIGISPADIVEFYITKKDLIFKKDFASLFKKFVFRKYSNSELEKALKECFGEDKIVNDCIKRIVIPTYNLQENEVCIFKTPHHERLKRDWKYPLWQVALATSAAPTYFRAYNKIDDMNLIDGGIWANNPIIIGIAEAKSMLNIDLDDMKVLSLGTTIECRKMPKFLNAGGMLLWAKYIAEVIMNGQSEGANGLAQHLIGYDNILRINPEIPEGFFKLDNVSKKKIMGKAAHYSRHYAPKVEEGFTKHFSGEYKSMIDKDDAIK